RDRKLRQLLQRRGRDRRRRQLPRQVPQAPHPAGQGLLGEVLLPPGQPRVAGVRHRRRQGRRLHLLRPPLPGGVARAGPRRSPDRLQPQRHQPQPVVLPVEAGAARRGRRQRVLRGRHQPGRRRGVRRQRLLRHQLLRRPARPVRRRRGLRPRRGARGARPRPRADRRGAPELGVLPRPPPRRLRPAGAGMSDDLLARTRAVLPSWLALYYEEPIEIERGEGRYVWDARGNRYLDFFGGILTTMTAHALPEVTKAVADQAGRIIHSSTLYLNRPMVELAEQIA